MNRAQRRALAKQTLWQAQATDQEGRQVPLGPATNVRSVPEDLCEGINRAVSEGREKDWRDARVVQVHSIET